MEIPSVFAPGGSVDQFYQTLVDNGIERAYFYNSERGLNSSHPAPLAELLELMEKSPNFADHEGIFLERYDRFRTVFFAFVHNTRRGLAQGGLRFKKYDDLNALLQDGLRLSRGMSRKNALADLWWGGGKGIIAETPSMAGKDVLKIGTREREAMFEAYGEFVASLKGVYYTAEDIGTKTPDMNAILRTNRFVTCIAEELGGSGNPSVHTARGVVQALKASWQYLEGTENLRGVKVAIQGVGNVGAKIAELLYREGAVLTICDSVPEAVEVVRKSCPNIEVCSVDEIFDVVADVFCPCATGGSVSKVTIRRLKVRLICGAANNILDCKEDGQALHDREDRILFIPDFISNRMGIFNCADEWQGPRLQQHLDAAVQKVYIDTAEVLKLAKESGMTPADAGDAWGDEKIAEEEHPLFGHRGKELIQRVVGSKWLDGASGRRSKNAAG